MTPPVLQRLLLPALLAAVLCAQAGCSRGAEHTADGRIVVNYWEKWTGFEAEAMRAVVDDFNRSQDRIKVQFLSVSSVDTKLLLAASGGNPPDLAGLWSMNVADFAEKGALTPLDQALAQAGIKQEQYVPAFWDLCRHRGFTWALPTTPACIAMYYNKRLFREAGLDPERPPRTIAELDEMNRRLTVVDIERNGKLERVSYDKLTPDEAAAKKFAVIRTGHLPQEPGWYREMWGYWFGAELADDHSILATHPGNIASLKWVGDTARMIGRENMLQFGATFGTTASPQNPFLSGSIAMVMQGPWMKNFIEKYAPDLEWGVAAFPAAEGVAGGAPVTLVETDIIVIPRGAKHPREAFEFIRYLQQQPVAEKLSLAMRKFTALKEVSPEFLAKHSNPAIGFFVQLARSPGARTAPRLSMWREYKDELLFAFDRVINQRATPAEALAQTQARVQWRFDRLQRRWGIVSDERVAEWREHERW